MKKCPTCSKKTNAPLLKESKVLSVISENMKYHINNKIALYNSPLKVNSKKYITLIKEARKLYSRNLLTLNEVDASIVSSNLGDKGDYNGQKVPLDLPTKKNEYKVGDKFKRIMPAEETESGKPVEMLAHITAINSDGSIDTYTDKVNGKDSDEWYSEGEHDMEFEYHDLEEFENDGWKLINSLDESINPEDVISMDIPLFIRMLEYAREDAKTDMDLHDVTEKATALSQTGDVLNMDNYDDIVGKKVTESYNMYHKNPSTKQVVKHQFNIYEQEFNVDRVRKAIEEILTVKEEVTPVEKPSRIKFLYNYTTDRFFKTIVEYEGGEEDDLNWYQTNDLLHSLDITVKAPDNYNEEELDKVLDELEYQNIKAVYDQSMSAPADNELNN